ncbi:MFS transporter [Micromonospora tulbaghiae]|uniref:MFS transporter n=1 Tax=Micromonospora tulbaghiae TaxID=479978 RepID=UPI003EC0E43C
MAASGRAADRPPRHNLVAILSIVVLSGAFFGYNQGVISGALHDIRHTFDVDTFEVEVAASWVTLGALAGGHLADRIGRRGALWVAVGAYVVGTVVQAAAPTIGALLGARLLLGVGIGVASVAGPMFAAEAAPERIWGGLLAVYQFSTTFAIFIGYLADELFTGGESWRYLLGAAVVLGVALILVTVVVPDSAVWYLKRGDRRRARESLCRTVPEHRVGSADLRDALLRAGAISVIVSDAAVATTTPQASLLPRGYWQDQPLAARLRVTVLVGADGVGAVLDELDRMGARRSDTFVQEAERVQS